MTNAPTKTSPMPGEKSLCENKKVCRNKLMHEVRNAMAGIQYERHNIARALVSMQDHMKRIEQALCEDATK